MPKTKTTPAELILGWQVTTGLDPRYWLRPGARAGGHTHGDLTTIPASAMSNHTAIIAQSGSGKSFFLGRLIEEITVNTKARCLILDPNADFRRINQLQESSLWQSPQYDTERRRGRLTHETTRKEFQSNWPTDRIRIRVGSAERITDNEAERLILPWASVSVDFLAEDLNPIHHSDLGHCHAVVTSIHTLLGLHANLAKRAPTDMIRECETLLQRVRQKQQNEQNLRSFLQEKFDCSPKIAQLFRRSTRRAEAKRLAVLRILGLEMMEGWFPLDGIQDQITRNISSLIEQVVTESRYVPKQVEHFYFSKVREYQSTGLLQANLDAGGPNAPRSFRIDVLDIPSLPRKATRLLAINTILDSEWKEARKAWSQALHQPPQKDERSPTFIVVDEAHNLIPVDPRGKAERALLEQFRTIVAEGRKYGLFLVLVSQRPDKLDPLVLSECENKAVMKLSSRSVLEVARKMLGLDDIPPALLEKSLEFETGRVLLAGAWAPKGPQITYSAARRTLEGGRNLRPEHWAVPYR